MILSRSEGDSSSKTLRIGDEQQQEREHRDEPVVRQECRVLLSPILAVLDHDADKHREHRPPLLPPVDPIDQGGEEAGGRHVGVTVRVGR